jgi:hypothetical protein
MLSDKISGIKTNIKGIFLIKYQKGIEKGTIPIIDFVTLSRQMTYTKLKKLFTL